MRIRRNLAVVAVLCLAAQSISAPALAADEEKKYGWSDTADFSLVWTGGNTETSTLGFRNKLWRNWEKALFTFDLGGIRAEKTNNIYFGVGTDSDFSISDDSFDELTAESYYATAQYDREITDRFFWLAGASWLRNEFAGIKNRTDIFGGVGNIWQDKEKLKWRTDYSLSYVDQKDVVEIPGADTSFAAVRLSSTFWWKFTKNAVYGNDLIVQGNLEESSDYFADMNNCVSVSMSDMMALRVGLRFLYFNEPAFELIPLFNLDPDDGGVEIGTVPRRLDKLDTFMTISLVVNFLGKGGDGSSPAC